MNEKRDIKELIQQEETHLNNLLEPNDLKSFKGMVDELRDTWTKKQIFRTETEARFSVLQDNRYPTQAAKYWQCIREQSVYLENLMTLSFDYRRNDAKIKWLQKKIESETDEYKLECYKIDLDEKIYSKASMEQVAKDRMREINMWSKLKLEFDDGTFDTKNVNTHQLESYHKMYLNKAKTITPGTSEAEVFNIVGQLESLERIQKTGELAGNKTEQLPQYGKQIK
jgi:hypothetical protein